MRESARLLERALKLNPGDYQIKVALGNANFDVGYFEKKNEPFENARKYYKMALDARPNDVDVRTDYALTYFLQTPPDNRNAIKEFETVLKDNPKQEKALQFLTRAYWQAGQGDLAIETLKRLRSVNPASPVIKELEELLLHRRRPRNERSPNYPRRIAVLLPCRHSATGNSSGPLTAFGKRSGDTCRQVS